MKISDSNKRIGITTLLIVFGFLFSQIGNASAEVTGVFKEGNNLIIKEGGGQNVTFTTLTPRENGDYFFNGEILTVKPESFAGLPEFNGQTGGTTEINQNTGNSVGGLNQGGGGAQNCNKKTSDQLQEALQQDIPVDDALQQQMVPTNPIPIVDPIKSIEENIRRIAAKEIGAADGGDAPSLDSVAACEVDKLIVQMIETSERFLFEGDDGNPMFVTDNNTHFRKIQDKIVEDFTNELKKNDTCGGETYKNIAESLLKAENAKSILNSDSSKTCSIDSGEGDKDDLNEIQNYFSWVNKHPALEYMKASAELSGIIGSETTRELHEKQISLGFNDIKDDEGKITTPAQVYFSQSLSKLDHATARVTQIEEANEHSELLNEFFLKVHLGPDAPSAPMQVPQNNT